jgi:hypothetical protein
MASEPKTFLDRIKTADLASMAKFIVALCGFLVILILALIEAFTTWLPDDWEEWLMSAVAFLTAVGVYLKKNISRVENLRAQLGTRPDAAWIKPAKPEDPTGRVIPPGGAGPGIRE